MSLYTEFTNLSREILFQTGKEPHLTITGTKEEIDRLWTTLYKELMHDIPVEILAKMQPKPKPGLAMNLGLARVTQLNTGYGEFTFQYDQKDQSYYSNLKTEYEREMEEKLTHFGE